MFDALLVVLDMHETSLPLIFSYYDLLSTCAGRPSETAESKRAHSGPLAAISAQGERVWTSGGAKQHPTLKLWSHKGDARCSAPLDNEGAAVPSIFSSKNLPSPGVCLLLLLMEHLSPGIYVTYLMGSPRTAGRRQVFCACCKGRVVAWEVQAILVDLRKVKAVLHCRCGECDHGDAAVHEYCAAPQPGAVL